MTGPDAGDATPCPHDRLVEKDGEMCCSLCGEVVNDKPTERPHEGQSVTNLFERHSLGSKDLLPKMDGNEALRKYLHNDASDKETKREIEVLKKFSNLCQKLGLTEAATEFAFRLFNRGRAMMGPRRYAYLAVWALYKACACHAVPKSPEEIMRAVGTEFEKCTLRRPNLPDIGRITYMMMWIEVPASENERKYHFDEALRTMRAGRSFLPSTYERMKNRAWELYTTKYANDAYKTGARKAVSEAFVLASLHQLHKGRDEGSPECPWIIQTRFIQKHQAVKRDVALCQIAPAPFDIAVRSESATDEAVESMRLGRPYPRPVLAECHGRLYPVGGLEALDVAKDMGMNTALCDVIPAADMAKVAELHMLHAIDKTCHPGRFVRMLEYMAYMGADTDMIPPEYRQMHLLPIHGRALKNLDSFAGALGAKAAGSPSILYMVEPISRLPPERQYDAAKYVKRRSIHNRRVALPDNYELAALLSWYELPKVDPDSPDD